MGLDIHLYRRNKKRKRVTIKEANREIITLLEQSPIKELRELKEYSQYIEKPFIECLKEAINDYVGVTGVDVIYSDMDADDFCETCYAEEYSPIPSTKYVPKSLIESVSFNSQQPTQKQLDYIQTITDELGIEFNGKTKEEARH